MGVIFAAGVHVFFRIADPEADLLKSGYAETFFQHSAQFGFELIAKGGDPGLIAQKIGAVNCQLIGSAFPGQQDLFCADSRLCGKFSVDH